MKVVVAGDKRVVAAGKKFEVDDKMMAEYAEELQEHESSQYWRLVYQPFEPDVSALYQRPV